MTSLSLTPLSSTSVLNNKHKPLHLPCPYTNSINIVQRRKIANWRCRAELAQEAPFVAAIGASILNSFVFPLPLGPNDEEDGASMIDSADARFAVMGIISFIPYFNWMSWVFAWMDTGSKRYLFYAIVYLAPYLRTNLSLSPDESWLPITSIILCIIHIQIEASVKNGDLEGFQLFNQSSRNTSSLMEDTRISEQGRRKDGNDLPFPDDVKEREVPGEQPDHLNEGDAGKKH